MTAKLVSIERRTADGQRRPVTLLDERRAVTARNDAKVAHVEAGHQDALKQIDAMAAPAIPTPRIENDHVGVVRGLVAIALALLVMALVILSEEYWNELLRSISHTGLP